MNQPKKPLSKVITQKDLAAQFEGTLNQKTDNRPTILAEAAVPGVSVSDTQLVNAEKGTAGDYLKNLLTPTVEQENLEQAEAKAMQEQAKKEAQAKFRENEAKIGELDEQVKTIKKTQRQSLDDSLNGELDFKVKELEANKSDIANDQYSILGLQDLEAERKKLYNKYAWKGAGKDTGFLDNPLSYLSEAVENTTANLVNHFSSPVEQMDPTERAKYETLTNRINTIAKPIVSRKIELMDQKLAVLDAEIYAQQETTEPAFQIGNIRADNPFGNKDVKELRRLKAAETLLMDAKREGEAYLNNQGASDVLGEALSQVILFNDVKNTVNSIGYVAPALDKHNAGEKLTAGEQMLVESLGLSNDLILHPVHGVANKQSFGYRTVRGLQYSGEFIRDMIGGNLVAKGLKSGLTTGATRVATSAATSTLRNTGSRVTANIVAGTIKGAGVAGALAVQTIAMPYSYAKTSAQNYIGTTVVDYDAEGNPVVYVRDQVYNKFKSDFDKIKTVHNSRRNQLLNKGEDLTEDEEKELETIEYDLGIRTGLFHESLDEALEKLKPMSWLEASAKGVGTTFTENLVERYTRDLLGAAGKGLNRIKPINYLTSKAQTIAGKFANTKVGRYYNNFVRARNSVTDRLVGERTIGGFGEEFAEEYAVAPLNALVNQDMREVTQMGDWDTNVDIAAQTFIMTTGLGAGSNAYVGIRGRLGDKRIRQSQAMRKNARTTVDNLLRANTDEQVGNVVDLMTARSGFSISDTELQIEELRATDQHREANMLENTMFQNIVSNAFATGTHNELSAALGSVANSTTLSEQTKLNALKAKENLDTLKPIYERYRSNPNSGKIVQLAFEKILNRQSTDEVSQEMSNMRPEVDQEFKAFQQANRFVTDFTLEQVMDPTFEETLTDEADKTKYRAYVDAFEKSNSPVIQSYLNLSYGKETLEQNMPRVMRAFNEAVRPSQNTVVRNKFVDAIRQSITDIRQSNAEDDNAEFNFNNELRLTEPLVNSIIDSLAPTWTGRLADGKLSKAAIEEVRALLLGSSSQQQAQEQLEAVEVINAIYDEAPGQQEEADVILNPEPEEAEEEFETAEADNLMEGQDFEPNDIGDAAEDLASYNQYLDDAYAAAVTDDPDDFGEADQDDLFENYSPLPVPTRELGAEERNVLKDKFSRLFDAVLNTNNRKPEFEDIIGYMLNFDTKENVEKHYNNFRLGWELNNLGEVDFDGIYTTIFDPFKDVRDEFMNFSKGLIEGSTPTPTTPEAVAENTLEQEKDIEEETAVPTDFTEENLPIQSIGGKRINHAEFKLGFSALRYNEIQLEDGTWIRETAMDGKLNFDDENSIIDFRDLLNPDMYNKGAQLYVAVAPETLWPKIKIVTGRNEDGSPKFRTFSELFMEKEAENPTFRTTKEFMDIVPVLTYGKDGKPVSLIHDVNWYNIYNVADPSSVDGRVNPARITKAHWDLIQKGKDKVSELRRDIIENGVNTITISDKLEGAFYTVANRVDADGNLLPLMTITEANPQAEIALQFNQGRLGIEKGNFFENNTRKLINRDQIQQTGNAGDTWNLRRIGTDPKDGKETWRAFKVVRYVSQEQLDTLRWAWAAHAKLSQDTDASGKNILAEIYARTVVGTPYDLTNEQAQKIIDDIRNFTGYNLAKWKDANAFMKLYFQPRSNDKIWTYGNTLYTNNPEFFAQHTSSEGLQRNSNVVTIANASVTDTGKNYVQYLKDTLLTDVKSFNVGTEEKPVYATSVQPVILFEYDNQSNTETLPAVEQLQERNQLLQEVAPPVNTEEVMEVVNKFNELRNSLGFNLSNFSALPVPLIGTEYLSNIFNVTPGLSISQEGHLVDFVYNYVLSAIDIKYKAKVDRASLLRELGNSYEEIVGPAKAQVQAFVDQLTAMNSELPEVLTAIQQGNQILGTFESIKQNWDRSAVKTAYESQGLEYLGQLGIIEKAMEEVNRTSDIKEEGINDDETQDEEDVSMRIKSFEDNASLTESGKQKTTYRLRRFMAGIQRRNPDGSVKRGFLGLPEYVGFNEVYDSIFQLLGTGVYIQSDYKTMRAKILEMQESTPWVTEFIEKLDNADEQLRKEFVYNYRKHAVAMKFAMYSSGNGRTKLKVFDTNANEIGRVIIDGWANNFITTPMVKALDGEYSIDKEVVQKLLDQYDSWGTDKAAVPHAEVRAWLANFGISLSDGYWQELVSEGFKYGRETIEYKNLFSDNNTPIGLLHKYLKKIATKEDTNFEEDEKNHPFGDMGGVLKALAKGQSRYSAKTLSKSFRDAGKNISGLTAPTYVTNRVDDLKRAAMDENSRELITDLQSLSISQDSLLLELLLTEEGFASKLETNYLGLTAFKELGKKASNFASITDLNTLDHDVTKLTMFQDTQQGTVKKTINGFSMRIGRMFLPTMSDKSQMLMLATGVFNFMEDSTDAFQITGEDMKFTDSLRGLLYQRLVLPELKRILNFHNNIKETNITGYDKAAQIFNFIPALNNIKDANGYRLIKHLAVAENITLEKVEELFKPAMMDVVENVIHSLAKQKMDVWESFVERSSTGKVSNIKFFDNKYLSSGRGDLDSKFRTGVYDYVLNSMLVNADMFTVIAGDPAMYSQDKNFKKSPIPFDAVDDNFYFEVAEKNGVNIGKRLALLIAPGSTLADSQNQEYRQVFLQDSNDIASNSEYLVKLFYGEQGLSQQIGEMTIDQMLKEYPFANETTKKLRRSQLSAAFPSIADYFDIESTDAQEYTTVQERLTILEGQGRLTVEQRKVLTKKLIDNEPFTKEELGTVLQPTKPVYTGQIIDKKQDVARVVYIKSSAWPLIPQVTAGTKLDGLRIKMEQMETEGGLPVRASYQTANKVGSMKGAIDPFNPESLKLADQASIVLKRNDFRIQQDVPYKSDSKKEDQVSMGTQIFKLLFGDGMMELDGFEVDGEAKNGVQMYDYYRSAFEGLMNVKKQNLYKELGLDTNGNSANSQLTVQKIQELLQKEAVKRGYLIQDIRGLQLQKLVDREGNSYYDFRVPLWLSVNSNRYESLLNSIITNRLMAHKLPGSGFVAGSESGFGFQKDLKGVDASRIIYMDGWNGRELEGVSDNGTFTKAQVFAPSKFRTPDGKMLDLFQKKGGDYVYLEKRDNGTWKLKEGMIDPALLNNFSFRTPTSSHVSGSSIEIVGILPPEVGDLLIVPKNFTKQKGLDYDIDKETAYQLNHTVDYRTGKIEVLSEEHKEKALSKLKKLSEAERKAILSEDGSEVLSTFYAIVGRSFDDEFMDELRTMRTSYEEKIDAISAKFDEKLYENKFIKSYLAVYNNPNPEVQKKINKVLSMDFARSQADLIEQLIKQGEKESQAMEAIANGMSATEASTVGNNNSFTILSDEYQKQKMGLGAAGKLAIGIYSNYVTFHGLVQQTDKPLRLTGVNEEGTLINKEVKIGNLTSDGVLGRRLTLDGTRSIAEAFAEKQNTATDNEKEQILGRVNINGTTIGVDSLLTLLGFDRDEKGNSIPYMLLSQPIMRKYVDRISRGKGIIADFQKNLEDQTVADLMNEYLPGASIDAKGTLTDIEGNLLDLSELLNGENLFNGIKYNGDNHLLQIAVLQKFLELKKYSKTIEKVQNLLNTNNLGKSIVESNLKFDDLKSFADNNLVSNTSSLIGDFIPVDNNTRRPEGYEAIGEYYIKPTTPQGQIVVNGLTLANRLWNQYFPYGDKYFELAVREALSVSNVDLTSPYKVIEARQDIIQEIKKYIYSRRGNGLFTEVAHEERRRLFIDTNDHKSLANYMNEHQNTELLKNNRLLNKLTYDVNTNGQPSLIKFNNTISDNFDEKYLYNSFAEMILEDKQLPDWNGEPMSTKRLAQELITYAYVEGGVQEAIQFIKYVPIEYLSEVGMTLNERFMPTNRLFQMMNPNRHSEVFKEILGVTDNTSASEHETYTFVKQYIQHFPEKATQVTYNDKRLLDKKYIEKDINKYDKASGKVAEETVKRVSSFILNSEDIPKFIVIRGQGKTKQDKYDLFENRGSNRFERIAVLGEFGMNEYDFANRNASSLLDNSRTITAPSIPDIAKPDAGVADIFGITSGQSITTIMESMASSTNPKFSRLSEVAKVLLPMLDSTTGVEIKDTAPITGGTTVAGLYLRDTNQIVIDPVSVQAGEGQMGVTLLHEIVHSVTERELRKYYNPEGTVPLANVPAWVTNLHLVYSAFRSSLNPEALRTMDEKVRKLRAREAVTFTSEELGLYYGASDIFEFVTTALTGLEFQQQMSQVPYMQSGRSIWDKFKEAVIAILRTLNPSITEGSIAEAAINETLNFIKQEADNRQNNATFVTPDFTPDDDVDFATQEDFFDDMPDFGDPDADTGPADASFLPTRNPFDC